jgi:trk system potassium uptake protein TrkH
MGRYSEYVSIALPELRSNPVVVLTLCALITLGAIGFFVWDDVTIHKWHFSQYKLHSKIAISVTLLMTIVGTPLFYVFEYHNTLEGMPQLEKWLVSLFSVVTPRTAGFEAVSSGELSSASTLLTILYMVVGGSSGSTAGGSKTTTIAIIFLSLVSSIKNESSINIFGRRLEDNALKRACSVLAINVILALTGTMIVCAVQPELPLKDVLFETFSAIDTVGMTTGITRSFGVVSKITVAFLMFLGRVGSLSFALVFTGSGSSVQSAQNPVEKINIG